MAERELVTWNAADYDDTPRAAADCHLACPVDVGDMKLLKNVGQHGNFIQWAPVTLLLMILVEAQGKGAL